MPSLPLDPRFWLWLDDDWVDVTAYVRLQKPVTLSRGQASETATPKPGAAKLVLDNSDDRFNPRNPLSPYYGKLRRNTLFTYTLPGSPRFYGEISSWEPQWNEDRSQSVVPIEPSGPLRRLGQGRGAVLSPLRRWMQNHHADIVTVGYWPLEDGPETLVGQPDIGSVSATLSSPRAPSVLFQKGALTDWLPNVVNLYSGDEIYIPVDTAGVYNNAWEIDFALSSTDGEQLIEVIADCGVDQWRMTIDYATGDRIVYAPNGDTAENNDAFIFGEYKERGTMWVQLGLWWNHPILPNGVVGGFSAASLYAGSYGIAGPSMPDLMLNPLRAITIRSLATSDSPIAIGHVAVHCPQVYTIGLLFESWNAARGMVTERALDRFERVCEEQSVVFGGSTDAAKTQRMGRQYVGTFLDQITDVVRTDGGLLREARDWASLEYVSLSDLYDLPVTATLDYAAGNLAVPLRPVDDDRATRNDILAKRSGGGEYRAVRTTGPMSIAPPESGGIGRYDSTYTGNPSSESRLAAIGEWQLSKGTQDVARWETITVNLLNPSIDDTLYAALLAVDTGHRIQLVNMDSAGVFEPVDLLVIGYDESVAAFVHILEFRCIPYGLYTRGAIESTWRLDSADTTTNEALDTTETGMDIIVGGAPWGARDLPYDLMVGGERMTATALSGAGPTQTFTVTRSVNGVVKGHDSGTSVRLADPIHIGLV